MPLARIAVSYASVGEAYEGAFSFSNPQAHLHTFRQLLRPFQVLTLNDPIMERFAKIRSSLRRLQGEHAAISSREVAFTKGDACKVWQVGVVPTLLSLGLIAANSHLPRSPLYYP